MTTWKKNTFSDLINAGLLMIGDGYRAKNEELGGGGYIFLRAGHVSDTHIDLTGVERFREDLSDKVTSKLSKTGDVVVTTKGNSTGRVAYMSPELPQVVYSPHLSFWRSLNHNLLVPGFVRYWSRGKEFQSQLEGMKTSTDMAPYLSLIDQKRLHITMPTPEDQKSIARILGALDDKIELNRQMNRTLEAVAQALFKSWFVDFDPVTAKAAGRKPYGMNEETAALFPDCFAESELGLIPEGWKPSKLGTFVSLTTGKSYASKELQDSATALVTLKSFHRGGGYRHDGLKPYIGSYKPEQVVKNGELIVACTDVTQAAEVVGRPAMVISDQRYSTLIASLDVMIIRPYSPNTTLFFYHLMRSTDYVNHIVAQTNGTTVLHLSKEGLPAFKFASPSDELITSFSKIASLTFAKIENNVRESETLATLRNSLLPKLLSGEIRVRQAENLVAEVV